MLHFVKISPRAEINIPIILLYFLVNGKLTNQTC